MALRPFNPPAWNRAATAPAAPAPGIDLAAPPAAIDPVTTPPIFEGYVRLADFGTKPRTGMTARLQLSGGDALPPVHPFKGLKTGQSSGHRLRAVLSRTDDTGEEVTLYSDEAMLTWWGEDCIQGMRLTLRFDDGPDGGDRHPLKGLETGQNGTVIYLACWAIDDDETLQRPEDARKRGRTPFNLRGAAQQAQIKCRLDEGFQEWCLTEGAPLLDPDVAASLPAFEDGAADHAAAVVRAFCRVASRAEFSEDSTRGLAARQKWSEMLRRYDDWMRGPPSSA